MLGWLFRKKEKAALNQLLNVAWFRHHMDQFFAATGLKVQDYSLDDQILMFAVNISGEIHSRSTGKEVTESKLADRITTCAIAIQGIHMLGRHAYLETEVSRKEACIINAVGQLLSIDIEGFQIEDDQHLGPVSAAVLFYKRLVQDHLDLLTDVDSRWRQCFSEAALNRLVEVWPAIRRLV